MRRVGWPCREGASAAQPTASARGGRQAGRRQQPRAQPAEPAAARRLLLLLVVVAQPGVRGGALLRGRVLQSAAAARHCPRQTASHAWPRRLQREQCAWRHGRLRKHAIKAATPVAAAAAAEHLLLPVLLRAAAEAVPARLHEAARSGSVVRREDRPRHLDARQQLRSVRRARRQVVEGVGGARREGLEGVLGALSAEGEQRVGRADARRARRRADGAAHA